MFFLLRFIVELVNNLTDGISCLITALGAASEFIIYIRKVKRLIQCINKISWKLFILAIR